MKALIVGGTGPSGPFLANGLIERGYKVTIFHRGTHEIPEIVPEVAHIHGDPHFRETIEAALGDRTFDVVIATYGRIRFVAAALAGKTPCFIAIGGVPSYRGYVDTAANFPAGLKVPVPEDAPLVKSEQEQRFSWLIKSTEDAVLNTHPNGVVYRYPYVYGPYQLVPREWCIIRRILDKRRTILLPDGGLSLMTHGYAAIWHTPCCWRSIIQRQQQDRFTIVAMKSSSRCGRCARSSAASSTTSSKWSAFRIRSARRRVRFRLTAVCTIA